MAPQIDRRDFLKLLPSFLVAPSVCRDPRGWKGSRELSEDPPPASIIIVVFDALSARHLSLYGYGRETSPNLARFAERAVVYHAHRAAGNFTVPGVASLLTGTYPWKHRAFHYAGAVVREYEQRNLFALLGDAYHRVAYPHNLWTHLLLNQLRRDIDLYIDPKAFSVFDDMLYDRLIPSGANDGFRALDSLLFRDSTIPGSFVFSLINRLKTYLWKEANLDDYQETYPRGLPSLGQTTDVLFLLEDVIDGILDVTSHLPQPFLEYYHLFPPHNPYRPRREFCDLFDDVSPDVTKEEHFFSEGYSEETLRQMRREYDQYVAHVDAAFGRLVDSMEATGILDNAYLIFTSDHGELFERGIWRHETPVLYEPVIHVPLVVSRPGQREREDVYEPTCCVDLVPTLLHIAGREVPSWCEGQVLPGLGGEGDGERSVFSVEAKSNAAWRPISTGTVALIKGEHKLIHYFGYPGYEDEYELFDLTNDPEEMANLYRSKKPLADALRHELKRKMETVNDRYRSGTAAGPS
ncbi:MAG: sulfatase-like hydrolase/transferase [Anaerolineae bacterium]|jgi:arylsulfatase A-like enzyme